MRRLLVALLLLAGLVGDARAATITLPEPIYHGIPRWVQPFGTVGFGFPSTVTTIDAAGEKVAFALPLYWRDTSVTTRDVAYVHFRVGIVTVAQPLKISLQSFDASGDPDGVVDQFRVLAAPVASTTYRLRVTSDGTDPGALRTVSRGERLNIVIEFDSAVGNIQIATLPAATTGPSADTYVNTFITGAWARVNTLQAMGIAVEFDDGSFAHSATLPLVGIGTTAGLAGVAINSGSTPDERGNIFTADESYVVSALWAWVDYDNPVDIVLYDTDGTTPLATVSAPSAAIRKGNADGTLTLPITAVTLVKGAQYRTAIKPTTTSNVSVARGVAPSNAALEAWYGTSVHLTTRTNGGSWTETSNEVTYCGPVFEAIEVQSGGVSGARIPNGM